MSALSVAKLPLTRDERLGRARAAAIRWVEAARDPGAPPGPFWRLLRAYAEDAETLGLNDARLKHYVKNGLRYLEFLRRPGGGETAAFDRGVLKAYQKFVAKLRREPGTQPPRQGERRAARRRPAVGDEPRLRGSTQELIVGAVGAFWEYADDNGIEGFDPMPGRDPTETLRWRGRETRPNTHVAFSVDELLATPFMPARGRSRFEHERNLLLALIWASAPTRPRELREATWRCVEVWEVEPDAVLPVRRWSLEAALAGDVAIDDARFVLFLVVGDVAATKSDEWRAIPLVGLVRERFLCYARSWITDQIRTLKYLRYRARRNLPVGLRQLGCSPTVKLLLEGRVISVPALVEDPALWRETPTLCGSGFLRDSSGAQKLSAQHAGAIRDLMWAAAARKYYVSGVTRQAGDHRESLFTGVVFPSRGGGPLSDAQVQYIWNQMGWTSKGWLPRRLRQYAFTRFEIARWQQLALIGPLGGHRSPVTTARHYAKPGPWLTAAVARLTTDRAPNSTRP